MSEEHRKRICAVIVTYHPDVDALTKGISAIAAQVDQVLVVDNSPAGSNQVVSGFVALPIAKVLLGENRGVASAQNIGIDWALHNGFSHVLLLDQDSVPAAGMVEQLWHAMNELCRNGNRVAAVGPVLRDGRDGHQLHFLTRRGKCIKQYYCNGLEIVRTEFLIASGSLMPLECINKIGKLESGLFIDYVDVEWGLRAQGKGYACYGVCGATLLHDMGDRIITSRAILGRRFQVYQPFRYYYQFRNFVALCRRPYVPLCLIIHIFVFHVLFRFFLCMALLPSRGKILIMMGRGLWHGLIGRTGRLIQVD